MYELLNSDHVLPAVSPKTFDRNKENCDLHVSMGMSARRMLSDYKPLNDFMCGVIALIFNFTLLVCFFFFRDKDKNLSEGGNCSIHLG